MIFVKATDFVPSGTGTAQPDAKAAAAAAALLEAAAWIDTRAYNNTNS